MRFSWILRKPFREQKWNDKFQLVIAKKEVQFDYVAIDVSALVGGGIRMAKSATTEQRRNKEVARYVSQSLHQLLKRFQATKGLALFIDGSETLHKANVYRSSTITRRVESRLMRLPATPLMQTVEERVVRMMPENRSFPGEVIFAGTNVPGPVEAKMAAWSLDVASKENQFGGGSSTASSICLIGSADLFLSAVAMTPFFHVSTIVQSNSDFKQMKLQDSLEWLTLDKQAKAGDQRSLSRMRSDITFLYTLCHGCAALDVGAIAGLLFVDVLDTYLQQVDSAPSASTTASSDELSSSINDHKFVLVEERGSQSLLNLAALEAVLSRVARKTFPPKMCHHSQAYLEQVFQCHSLISYGLLINPYFVPPTSGTPLLSNFLSHLKYLMLGTDAKVVVRNGAAHVGATRQLSIPPLTAAEYTVLSYSQAGTVESSITSLVGAAPKTETCRSLVAERAVEVALLELRQVFAFANPMKAHRCLCFSPSYCWLQDERTKLWTFSYINLGQRSFERDTRLLKGSSAEGSMAMAFEVSTDGPCYYSKSMLNWVPATDFSAADFVGSVTTERGDDDGTAIPRGSSPLKLLTWNVMFDRYSGKPTPLGMPGIDWCSKQRYPVLSAVMERSNADVIGMQEVEPQFWEFLAEQPWVRENYLLSCNARGPAINPWGVMLMVHRRIRVGQLKHHNVPAWSGHVSLMPVVTIEVNRVPIHIAVVHLVAPFTKSNESARTGQDQALRNRMTKNIVGDCITMGDFNDWPTSEFVMPSESHFVDAWPIVQPNDAGKTMDETNTFCKLKIEEIFFGRSDKVFVRGKRLVPVAAKLVGTKSVNEENGNLNAPSYLFPSDHYGVEMLFAVRGC